MYPKRPSGGARRDGVLDSEVSGRSGPGPASRPSMPASRSGVGLVTTPSSKPALPLPPRLALAALAPTVHTPTGLGPDWAPAVNAELFSPKAMAAGTGTWAPVSRGRLAWRDAMRPLRLSDDSGSLEALAAQAIYVGLSLPLGCEGVPAEEASSDLAAMASAFAASGVCGLEGTRMSDLCAFCQLVSQSAVRNKLQFNGKAAETVLSFLCGLVASADAERHQVSSSALMALGHLFQERAMPSLPEDGRRAVMDTLLAVSAVGRVPFETKQMAFIALGNAFSALGTGTDSMALPEGGDPLASYVDPCLRLLRSALQSANDATVSGPDEPGRVTHVGILMRALQLTLDECAAAMLRLAKARSPVTTTGWSVVDSFVPSLIAVLCGFVVFGLTPGRPVAETGPKTLIESVAPLSVAVKSSTSYVPPHLRKAGASPVIAAVADMPMNESESPGTSGMDASHVRATALHCLQILSRAYGKSVLPFWPDFLPTESATEPRPHTPTLATALLFDPSSAVRRAAAEAMAAVLCGPHARSHFTAAQLQSEKKGKVPAAFTTLSTVLGLIAVQVHETLVRAIMYELSEVVLSEVFHATLSFVTTVPFGRLPKHLLPTLISALRSRLASEPGKASRRSFMVVCSQLENEATRERALRCLAGVLSAAPGPANGRSDEATSSLVQDLLKFACENNPLGLRLEAISALASAARHCPEAIYAQWHGVRILLDRLAASPTSGTGEAEKLLLQGIRFLNEFLSVSSGRDSSADNSGDLDEGDQDEATVSQGARNQALFCRHDLSEHWQFSSRFLLSYGQADHLSVAIRAASQSALGFVPAAEYFDGRAPFVSALAASASSAAMKDQAPTVRTMACRSFGSLCSFAPVFLLSQGPGREILTLAIKTLVRAISDASQAVRISVIWAVANLCSSLRGVADCEAKLGLPLFHDVINAASVASLGGEKLKPNSARALGHLASIINLDPARNELATNHELKICEGLVSCLNSENAKSCWNAAFAACSLFANSTGDVAKPLSSALLLALSGLLDARFTNFKTKTHAAKALATIGHRSRFAGDTFRSAFNNVTRCLHVLFAGDAHGRPSLADFKFQRVLQNQLEASVIALLAILGVSDAADLKNALRLPRSGSELTSAETLITAVLKKASSQMSITLKENGSVDLEAARVLLRAMQCAASAYDALGLASSAAVCHALEKSLDYDVYTGIEL